MRSTFGQRVGQWCVGDQQNPVAHKSFVKGRKPAFPITRDRVCGHKDAV